MGKKKSIEYLWHKNDDDMAQFWEKECRQTYFAYPNTHMPKNLIGENSGNRIIAPKKLPMEVLGRRGILDAGFAVNTRGYYHSRSKKNYHIALFIQSGKTSVRFDGTRREAKKGDLIIIPKACIADETVTCPKASVYWMHIKPTPEWNALFGAKVLLRKARKMSEFTFALRIYEREVYSKERSIIFLENIADVLIEIFRREMSTPQARPHKLSADALLGEVRKHP